MTLTPSQLANTLPSGALTISSNDTILSFNKLNNGQSPTSIVPVLAVLLEGVAKLVEQVNVQRNNATPQLQPLTIISKSIQQNQSNTGVDPTQVTVIYSFTFDTSTENIIIGAIDPS